MRLEVLEYLKKYIKDKYPMYYDSDDQVVFMNFINLIGSDKKFKSELEEKKSGKTDKEILNDGDMDYVIDELVNTYAQIKYTKIWANLESLSSRIRNAITKEAQKDSGVVIINNDVLDKICQEIALGIIKNNQDDDYTIYFNGAYDFKYVEDYSYYLNEYRNSVLKRVQNIVNKKAESDGFKVSEDTYSLILSDITDKIITDFKYNDINKGLCDKKILSLFNIYRRGLREAILGYIDNYIEKEIIVNPHEINMAKVQDALLRLTVVNGEISAAKLLDGKLDRVINSFIEKNRKRKVTKIDAIRYIGNVLIISYDEISNEEELLELSQKMYDILRANELFDNDIVSGNYDDKIKFLYEEQLRVKNSIEDKNHPKKRKANWKKRKIYRGIISLILAGVITITAGKFVLDGIEYLWDLGVGIFKDITSRKALKKVDEFDNFRYSYVFTKYNDSYKRMVLNTADFYQKASGYDDQEYRYLGFYRMYENVREDRLALMDSALSEVKTYSNDKAELDEFSDSISSYSCYLDFVYDRLVSMGCSEIESSEYQMAINVYKNAKSASSGTELTAMDILILDFPEQASLVEKIMGLYTEYSEEKLVAFGNELINEESKLVQGGKKTV